MTFGFFVVAVVGLTWMCCLMRPLIPLFLLIALLVALMFWGPMPFS
jgi:hypothetical protein